MSKVIFTVYLTIFVSVILGDNSEVPDTLELVHVLFRHGERTPDKHVIYANDPHKNHTYSVGFGQLTNNGKLKEYSIGKALRKRYGEFLGNYTVDVVDARSTNYKRTKMSLQLVLASLYKPEGDQMWKPNFPWQPIPMNYWPMEQDHLLIDPLKNCPEYKERYLKYLNTSEGRNWYKKYETVIEYINEHAGEKMNSKKLAELWFTLQIEQENGLEIPRWAVDIWDSIVKFPIMDYNISTETPYFKRLTSGFLMKKILDDTRLKIENKITTKIFLYSGHEYNIAFLLRYLRLYYDHVPPYGAYLILEVHNYNGTRGINVLYQDYSTKKPKKLKISECGLRCPLSLFTALHRDILPASEQECYESIV